MHVIRARNVNDAYALGIDYLLRHGVEEASRNGRVLRSPVPVTTVFEHPTERVLFDVNRDANPFFHFLEGLWMLAGRNDAKWISEYAQRMSSYSDDGATLNGAYGHRWRSYFGYDQLVACINLLRKDPLNRRVVLGMWNPARDLVDQTSLDLPCNLAVKFFGHSTTKRLDMVVMNRSNDIIWGAYGANAVHMSMMHEYVATCAGMTVGTYSQISLDYHAYTELGGMWAKAKASHEHPERYLYYGFADSGKSPMPLVEYPGLFDTELDLFMSETHPYRWSNRSIGQTAVPMQRAWRAYKAGDAKKAISILVDDMAPVDWQLACIAWVTRHAEKGNAP